MVGKVVAALFANVGHFIVLGGFAAVSACGTTGLSSVGFGTLWHDVSPFGGMTFVFAGIVVDAVGVKAIAVGVGVVSVGAFGGFGFAVFCHDASIARNRRSQEHGPDRERRFLCGDKAA